LKAIIKTLKRETYHHINSLLIQYIRNKVGLNPINYNFTTIQLCIIIPKSTAPLEKLTDTQKVKKFIIFYGTHGVITMFTRSYYWPLSRARRIQSTSHILFLYDPF